MHCMGGALAGILYSRLLCLLMETKVLVKIIWSWRCVYSTIEGRKWKRRKEGRESIGGEKRRDGDGVVRCIVFVRAKYIHIAEPLVSYMQVKFLL